LNNGRPLEYLMFCDILLCNDDKQTNALHCRYMKSRGSHVIIHVLDCTIKYLQIVYSFIRTWKKDLEYLSHSVLLSNCWYTMTYCYRGSTDLDKLNLLNFLMVVRFETEDIVWCYLSYLKKLHFLQKRLKESLKWSSRFLCLTSWNSM